MLKVHTSYSALVVERHVSAPNLTMDFLCLDVVN